MSSSAKKYCLLFLVFVLAGLAHGRQNGPKNWKKIDQGLHIGIFEAPQKSILGDSAVTVLKINPDFYSFKVLCSSEHDQKPKTTKQWCEKFGLIAAINAGMFQKDRLTHVSLMKNYDHYNNPRLSKNKAVLAFNPIDSSLPDIQIIDREFQPFEKLKDKYHTLIQNIRMVTVKQKNVWSRQEEQWSIAAMGIDKQGNVLFIFSRSPYSVHDFINILLALPISLYNAMYLEGGPTASLYFKHKEFEKELHGGYELGIETKSDDNRAPAVPNVIGMVQKTKQDK